MDNNVEFVQNTFNKLLIAQKQRLENGLKIREFVNAHINNGTSISHYRVDYMEKGVRSVMLLLNILAKDFNEQHPQDCYSSMDFLDILMSAYETLAKVAKK